MRRIAWLCLGVLLFAGCAQNAGFGAGSGGRRCDRNGDADQRAACNP
jgi:hypothetical protein